jgi:hypothetical protein
LGQASVGAIIVEKYIRLYSRNDRRFVKMIGHVVLHKPTIVTNVPGKHEQQSFTLHASL